MADSSYQQEVQNLMSHLNLQHTTRRVDVNPIETNFNPNLYVAPRFWKKQRSFAKY